MSDGQGLPVSPQPRPAPPGSTWPPPSATGDARPDSPLLATTPPPSQLQSPVAENITATSARRGNRRPIRGVLITPGLQLGGSEVWARTMVTDMDPQRIEWQGVVVAHPTVPLTETIVRPIAQRTRIFAPPTVPGVPEFPGMIERYPNRKAAVARAIAGADVVVCWALGSLLSEMLSEFKGPVVAVSHGVCRWTRANMLAAVQNGATHIAAVGRDAAEACPNPQDVKIIYNGICPDRCRPTRNRAEVRREWGIESEEVIAVGYVGRFDPEKNATAPALGVGQLPARYRAILVGQGSNSRRDEETRAIAQAAAGPRVIFRPATEQVGDIYAGLDVLVMASPAEGCSLTVIEAWLAGLPLVSTPVGIIPEMEAKVGVLAIPIPLDATAEELARAIRQAAHAGRGSEIVMRAQTLASKQLIARHMVDQWASYLEEIVPPQPVVRSQSPKISIVVPAWNEAQRIEKSLRSILAQTCQDFELIVVDDGSQDSTAQVAEKLLAGRPNCHVIRKANGGTGSALNHGFQLARGDYLTWWSADSWVSPQWLHQLKTCLDRYPEIVMAYGDWEIFDEPTGKIRTRHVPEFDRERLLRECYIGPCWLFRKEAKQAAGEYLEEPCEDYDMHLRLAEIGPFRRVPEILGTWRNHLQNLTNRLVCNPQCQEWYGQTERIQQRHRERIAINR